MPELLDAPSTRPAHTHALSRCCQGWIGEQAHRAAHARPARAARPARVLFDVPFRSAMADEHAERLGRQLDMELHLRPKHPAVAPPLGVARLDRYSGLFLMNGDAEGEWVLQCRTWGDPPPELVRDWRQAALLAARQLDPGVAAA